VTDAALSPWFECELLPTIESVNGTDLIRFRTMAAWRSPMDASSGFVAPPGFALLMPEMPYSVIPFELQIRPDGNRIARSVDHLPTRFQSITVPFQGIPCQFGLIEVKFINVARSTRTLEALDLIALFPIRPIPGFPSRHLAIGCRTLVEWGAELGLPFGELSYERVFNAGTGTYRREFQPTRPCGRMRIS
jgi:hypothetical protein